MKVFSGSSSLTPSSARSPSAPPVIPVQQASNSAHQRVPFASLMSETFDASAYLESRYAWEALQRSLLASRTAGKASATACLTLLQFPRQQQEVIAALNVLAKHPQQLTPEQTELLKAFSAGGGEMLTSIARDMDYHATFNPDFGYGHVEFYGLPADVVKTPCALQQVGFRYYRQDGGGKNFHATTFYYHFHPWSCLNGIVKWRPLHVNIPLCASEEAMLTFFNQAEQHIKASQDNEKMVLAVIAKMIVSLLNSRPEWFSTLSADARNTIVSGADFPLLHHMMQLLPDNAPLQQRFTDNQYFEWKDGAFRSTRDGEILQESPPAR